MMIAVKCRMYLKKNQAEQALKTLGCCRYVYNLYLNTWNILFQFTGKDRGSMKQIPLLFSPPFVISVMDSIVSFRNVPNIPYFIRKAITNPILPGIITIPFGYVIRIISFCRNWEP